MSIEIREMAAFGVAGNFTGHLEQAGEASDFTNVKTAEANAPKAMFPTYIPGAAGCVPEFLGVYPFDESKIIFPTGEEKLQIEPECAIIFEAEWENGQVKALRPLVFGASNDCSIRKEGARKISQKKNWGACSKGFSGNPIPVDSFTAEGVLNRYRIASFLVRDGEVHAYGEDSAIRDYSYVYEKLNGWMIDKLNHQADEGPAEPINSYLNEIGCPTQLLISIGATRYTDFGEHNFLQSGDDAVVVLYPEDRYSGEEIAKMVKVGAYDGEDISVLSQRVVFE